jgi:hypothetical protein
VSDLEAAKHIDLGIIMVCKRDKRRRGACLNWEDMGGKGETMVKGDVYVVYVAPAAVNRRPSNAPACTLGRPSILASIECTRAMLVSGISSANHLSKYFTPSLLPIAQYSDNIYKALKFTFIWFEIIQL